MIKIVKPGLYGEVPEADYHADCVEPAPSLSNSIAKLLVTRSPRHAAHKHPRLNPNLRQDDTEPNRTQDIGTAAHKIILGRGRIIDVMPFDDYRKDAAKKARDNARASGRVPILADDMASVELLAEAARDQIASTSLANYFDAPGRSEVTMVWREGEVWCRGRVDRLPDSVLAGGHVVLADLKTTGGSAHPDDWQSTAFDLAFDVQAVMYPRGLQRLVPDIRSVTFKFAVLEQKPPYGLSVVEFSGQALEEAAQLVDLAIKMWAVCLRRGEWPGYDDAVVDPPHWRSMRAEMRRLAMLDRIQRWQRPLGLDHERRPSAIEAAE